MRDGVRLTAAEIRVAFDVTSAISGRTGIARYVNELAWALERRGVDVRRFGVGRAVYPPPERTKRLHVPARALERWWRTLPGPTAESLVAGAELVHATGLVIPCTRRPLVVTVHDLAALRHPELHPARNVRQQRALLAGLDRASVVLAVSESTAHDLNELGVPPEKVTVAPLGVTPLPAAGSEIADELGSRRYLLMVGETSPRKRYSVIVRALARLDRELDLVIAGPPGSEDQPLQALAAELSLSRRLKRLVGVSDAALANLYNDALALCFPSLAEGFGLPVLEAMAAGLPVLASDIPAVREVAGDAAVLVSGDGEGRWAEAIDAVLSDERLRENLAAAGRRRAANYTWERTAAATLDGYRRALGA